MISTSESPSLDLLGASEFDFAVSEAVSKGGGGRSGLFFSLSCSMSVSFSKASLSASRSSSETIPNFWALSCFSLLSDSSFDSGFSSAGLGGSRFSGPDGLPLSASETLASDSLSFSLSVFLSTYRSRYSLVAWLTFSCPNTRYSQSV